MAKIQDFPKSRLKTSEALALGQAAIEQILSANTDVTKFKTQFDPFKDAVDSLKDSIFKISKSMWTDSMKKTGKIRNNLRTIIFTQIRAYNLEEDGEYKAAATVLMPLIERYKYLYLRSFDDQTGAYYKLIEESRSETFKKSVETLKLDALFTKLQTANNECAQCSSQRAIEAGERNMPLKTPVTRKMFNTTYEALVNRLNSLAEIEGDEDYIKLFAWWNETIDKYRVTMSLRFGKGKGGKTASGSMSKHDPNTGGNKQEEERPGEL